jgi:hypothetical protein
MNMQELENSSLRAYLTINAMKRSHHKLVEITKGSGVTGLQKAELVAVSSLIDTHVKTLESSLREIFNEVAS